MKNLLLPFVFLLFFLTQTKAQTSVYHPFPDSGIVWREDEYGDDGDCCCSGGGVCLTEEHYQFFLAGDTLINSEVYSRVFKTGWRVSYIDGPSTCPPGCVGYSPFYYSNLYVGAMRQDTVQREVFYIEASSPQELLLYDFNLNVGDTLPVSYNNDFSSNYVGSIDSVLIAGNYRKRFWISYNSDSDYVAVIEGIGSTFGLLATLFPDGSNTLSCVTINSVPVYPDTATVCVLETGVNEVVKQENYISLYPNPAANQLTIQLPSLYKNEVANIFIFNVLGQETSPSATLLEEGGVASIDVSALSQGVYFVEVVGEKGKWVGKFVKE